MGARISPASLGLMALLGIWFTCAAAARDAATMLGSEIEPVTTKPVGQANAQDGARIVNVALIDLALMNLGLDALGDTLPASPALATMIEASPAIANNRGKKEIAIHQRATPAVVLIQGNGTCAGTLLDAEGTLLTCWHCVRDQTEVFVRLYPGTRKSQPARLYRAKVVRVDVKTDLALLKLIEAPTPISFITLGSEEDVQPGADVLAIGHPTGRFWSLQRGMVSQIHAKYLWSPDKGLRHEAEAIQAQLPLMEGNSGGPLLSESGEIIGVNATHREGDAFAYAIALKEIRRFLNGNVAQTPNPRPQAAICQQRFLSQGRSRANDASLIYYDTNCDNRADAYLHIPDKAAQLLQLVEAEPGSDRIGRVRTLDRQTGRMVKLDVATRIGHITLTENHADTLAVQSAVLTVHGRE